LGLMKSLSKVTHLGLMKSLSKVTHLGLEAVHEVDDEDADVAERGAARAQVCEGLVAGRVDHQHPGHLVRLLRAAPPLWESEGECAERECAFNDDCRIAWDSDRRHGAHHPLPRFLSDGRAGEAAARSEAARDTEGSAGRV